MMTKNNPLKTVNETKGEIMRRWKKAFISILTVFLCLGSTFAFVSCGDNNSSQSDGKTQYEESGSSGGNESNSSSGGSESEKEGNGNSENNSNSSETEDSGKEESDDGYTPICP